MLANDLYNNPINKEIAYIGLYSLISNDVSSFTHLRCIFASLFLQVLRITLCRAKAQKRVGQRGGWVGEGLGVRAIDLIFDIFDDNSAFSFRD